MVDILASLKAELLPEYEQSDTLAINPELARPPSRVPAKQKELRFIEGVPTQAGQFSFWNNLGIDASQQARLALLEEGEAPPGWKPNNEILAQFPREYWGELLEAEGPKQQALIAEFLRDDISRRQKSDRAGWGASLVGGGLAFAADWYGGVGVLARLGKYGLMGAKSIEKLMDVKTVLSIDVGAGVARNALGTIPSAAGIAAVYNAPRLSRDATYSLNEYLVDGLLETGFGAVLGGLSGGVQAKLLKNDAKGYAHYGNGVDFEPVIGKDGEFKGMKAVPAEGHSVGAAEVDAAQVWADTRMQAYKGSGFLNKVFGFSPIVRGLTSEFPVQRAYTEAFFNRGGIQLEGDILKPGQSNPAPKPTFEQEFKSYVGSEHGVQFEISKQFDEYIGITGYHKDAQALIKSKIEGPPPYNKREFDEEVNKAMRNGDKHIPEPGKPHVPQIEAAARIQRKWDQHLFDEEVALGIRMPVVGKVVGAESYAQISYNKPVMDVREDAFINDISEGMWTNSQAIERLNNMYTPEEIQAKVDAGEIDPMLVEQPIPLTPKDIDHIRALNTEIESATNAIEEASHKISKEALDIETARFKSEAADVQQLAQAIVPEQKRIRQDLKDLADEKASLRERIDFSANEREIADLTASLDIVNGKIDESKTELEFIQKVLPEAKEEAAVFAEKEHKDHLKRLNQEKREYKQELADLRKLKNELISKRTGEKAEIRGAVDKERVAVEDKIAAVEDALSQNKRTVSELEQEVSDIKSLRAKYFESKERISALNREQAGKKKAAAEAREALYRRIEADIEAGKIPETVAVLKERPPQKGPGFWLVDEKQLPKLFKPLSSRNEARNITKGVYTKIMGTSPEDLVSAMKGGTRGIGGGNNSLMRRTLMVSHDIKAPYLEKSAKTLSKLNTISSARRIALEKTYRGMGYSSAEEGILEVATLLEKQIELAKAPLLKDTSSEGIKKLHAFNDKAKAAREFMELSNQVAMGKMDKGSAGVRNFFGTLQKLTVIKALGGLPLLQVAEAGSLLKQYQLFELFDKGLFPLIRSAFSGGQFLEQQDTLAHAGLAINTYLGAQARAWESGLPADMHKGWAANATNAFARGVDVASQKFMNLTLSNPIQDMLQHISGTQAMSQNIEAMYIKMQGGAYTARQWQRLRLNGLDPEKWADRIIKQYEKYGDTQAYAKGKSFESNAHLWDDMEARQAFLSATKKEVETIVLTPNYLDVPFGFRGPIRQAITMFMSYGFAAANSRLLPMLQSGDIRAMQAEVANLTAAMFVQPIRDYLNGDEPDLSSKALMGGALTNWGFAAFPLEFFNRANAVVADKDTPILGAFKNNRYDARGLGAILGGAPGGYAEGLINLWKDASSGKITQGTLRNALRMGVPGASAWYARKPLEALIESTGLPEKRKDAQAWFPEANDWIRGLEEW